MIFTSNPSICHYHVDGVTRPGTVIGNAAIRETFCDRTLEQFRNVIQAPGVTRAVLNPDAHLGYGAPVGSVLVSEDMVYPGPVGVDIKCSMSLLQTNIPGDLLKSKPVRRVLMKHLANRIPNGAGYSKPELSPRIGPEIAHIACVDGASDYVLDSLGIPSEWRSRCEDYRHGNSEELEYHFSPDEIHKFDQKAEQLGSLGGGNHFLEAEITRFPSLEDLFGYIPEFALETEQKIIHGVANSFGLKNGCLSFLTHCGSRGIGHALATRQFKALQAHFDQWRIPFPGGDRELVYAPRNSPEGRSYLNDMYLGANFATVNHLLINKLAADAVREVFPDAECELVYFISHNIVREEIIDNKPQLVHRKGATRAYPTGHHSLKGTLFEGTGHPILLPGNPVDGSAVMVAFPGAEASCYSINHGAGRRLGRRQAKRELDQDEANILFDDADVLFAQKDYPIDESPSVYKNFGDVLSSVEEAGLAGKVANLDAIFVVKDGGKADD